MATIPRICVPLSQKTAFGRYGALAAYRAGVHELLEEYLSELDLLGDNRAAVEAVAGWTVVRSVRQEIQDLSEILGVDQGSLKLINLYYDLANLVFRSPKLPSASDVPTLLLETFKKARPFACTAFAFVGPDGKPWHARNLDWWSRDERRLASGSLLIDYKTDTGAEFTVLGWPGLSGALTGVRKGAFTVSLNTVCSNEPFTPGASLPILIREVLEECATYQDAVRRLSETRLLSDGLLLVTGTEPGEMVVIERSPSRYAHRYSDSSGLLVVTNSYKRIATGETSAPRELAQSADNREAGVCDGCALGVRPKTLEECMEVLRRPDVRMGITMQRVAMRASDGAVLAESVEHS
jgi:hypothetical protein